MAIKKIIYVTEGQNDYIPDIDPTAHGRLGDLNSASIKQIERVLSDVIVPEFGGNKILFKSSGYRDPSWEVLGYLDFLLHKQNINTDKDVLSKSEAYDIDEVSIPKDNEDVIIFGTTHRDFDKLIASLKSTGYNVIDKEAIKHRENIYTLTVYLDGKKNTDFHEFGDDDI